MTSATESAVRHLGKRQAQDEFRAAKLNEQQMHPAADSHRQRHGCWPGDYLAARDATARAFERYVDAGVCSGITVTA